MRRHGKSYAHPFIVLVALPNERDTSRFGFSAGRSVGKAVQRNRAKRLMREAMRSVRESVRQGWDILLLARRPLADATYWQTQSAVISLLEQADLLEDAHHGR